MEIQDINIEQCTYVSGILKQLAHPQRLMILCLLSEKDRSVNELAELTGASQSSVSQFLNKMKLQGLVERQAQGQQAYYSIADEKVLQLMSKLHEVFCP